jgi:hypothetical protein
MRQRYYARRGKTLDPETLLNETGNADMVVCKIASKSNKVAPQWLSSLIGMVVYTLIYKLFYKRILTVVFSTNIYSFNVQKRKSKYRIADWLNINN